MTRGANFHVRDGLLSDSGRLSNSICFEGSQPLYTWALLNRRKTSQLNRIEGCEVTTTLEDYYNESIPFAALNFSLAIRFAGFRVNDI